MKVRLMGARGGRCVAGAIVAVACGLSLAACGPRRDARPSAAATTDDAAGYAVPPQIVSAQRLGDAVVISGQAQPDSRLRLQSPEGDAFGGTVGADGGWSMPAPTPGGPHLYAVGEEVSGRIVRAEGYVAALPTGRPAALLRPGVGALALGGAPNGLQIGAVDYDVGGWAFVSGMAPPGAAVQLQVDDQPTTQDKADAQGRFSIPLKPAELTPGAHRLQMLSATRNASAQIAVSPAGSIPATSYQARRQGAAWRIDWKTPGGGVQTSLILDP